MEFLVTINIHHKGKIEKKERIKTLIKAKTTYLKNINHLKPSMMWKIIHRLICWKELYPVTLILKRKSSFRKCLKTRTIMHHRISSLIYVIFQLYNTLQWINTHLKVNYKDCLKRNMLINEKKLTMLMEKSSKKFKLLLRGISTRNLKIFLDICHRL